MRLSTVTAVSAFTEKTFRDFSFFHNITLKSQRNALVLVLLFSVGLLNISAGRTSFAISFLGITLGLVLIYVLLYKFSVRRQIKLLKFSDEPKEAYTVTLDDIGLTVRYDEEHTKTFPWSGMYRVFRVPGNFYFYVTKDQAFVLPYECLNGVTPDAVWMLIIFNTGNTKIFDHVGFFGRA